MKIINLKVPQMQSVYCQGSVSNAAKTIKGVQVEAGEIAVSLTIEKTGYNVE